MPLNHTSFYGYAISTTQIRLDLGPNGNPSASSKTDSRGRSYDSSKFMPLIENVVFQHFGLLSIKAKLGAPGKVLRYYKLPGFWLNTCYKTEIVTKISVENYFSWPNWTSILKCCIIPKL